MSFQPKQYQESMTDNTLTQQNSGPVQTYIKPAPIIAPGYTPPQHSAPLVSAPENLNNTNLAELNNYMEYQKLAPTAGVDQNNKINKENENTGTWSKPRKSSDVDSPDNKDDSE